MDYQFPPQLFPSFYNCGPPDTVLKHYAGSWGSYDRVRPQGSSGPLSNWTFRPRHQARGETWRHTEPVPVPLLSPKNAVFWPSTPPDPLDFTEHNFFMDHPHDAFGCMSEILGEHFNLNDGVMERSREDLVRTRRVRNFLKLLEFKICQQSYFNRTLNGYSAAISDVVQTIPPELLGALLYEELTEQRDRMLFSEGATGGALAFVPFSESGSSSQRGCLLYPGSDGLNSLNFHRVELQHHRDGSSSVDASSSDPLRFQLKAPIRQISSASMLNDCCVAVRSDHLCGVWRFSEKNEPRLLQVVNTKEVATCISVSPHVLGEVLVASESGAANLWTVGRGMQKVREEDHNLYFNAKSSWRWCEFSAHPRVVMYADRTGVELTDIRVKPFLSHTLFRVSSTSDCRSGERLILCKYLGDAHSFHHLITTQYSAYIMDERFPSVPMLKWDHMMQSPPMFCHVLPGNASSGSAVDGAGTTKVLLGSQSSQDITLLQYSGGRAEACFSCGPPQALLRPRDSLKHLPVQIPHRLDAATNRLSSPAAGLTCIQKKGSREAGGGECICVLQLTEAGDLFYQTLEHEESDGSRPRAAEDELLPQQTAKKPPQTTSTTSGRQPSEPDSYLVVSDTSSNEGIIEPTQRQFTQRLVAETPERGRGASSMFSDSEDSEPGGRNRSLQLLSLQVMVNDPELDQVSGVDTDVEDGKVDKNNAGVTEEPVGVGETVSHMTPVKISDCTLATWKHWLQKLIKKRFGKKLRQRRLQHFTIKTEGILHPYDAKARDVTEEERVQSLRRDLRACMSKRSLLVHSAVSASIEAPDVVLVPKQVDTDIWTDKFNQRLTLSWEGEDAWRACWEDQLGLNKEQKVEALRRKRRKEKEAKRASGRRLELSGSFTSSVSYQSDLGNLSDSFGWSSAASQEAWLDIDGVASQPEDGEPKGTTPSMLQTDTPVPTPTATPQSVKDKGDRQARRYSGFSLTQTPKLDSTPTSQRRNKRPGEDYLRSLFAPQDEPQQHDHLEEGSTAHPPTSSLASSQQHLGSQSSPLKTLVVDLSKNALICSSFSQSLSLSQSSQGRQRLSQASQPKKKKSRMGF